MLIFFHKKLLATRVTFFCQQVYSASVLQFLTLDGRIMSYIT